jgi:hypothetical protein
MFYIINFGIVVRFNPNFLDTIHKKNIHFIHKYNFNRVYKGNIFLVLFHNMSIVQRIKKQDLCCSLRLDSAKRKF